MSADKSSLYRLLKPDSIAVIGASNKGLYQAGILRNLLDGGFPGEIFPINPKYNNLFGLKCYSGVNQLPFAVALAIIVVNRQRVIEIVKQCAEFGVKSIVIITAGFSESDETGRELQHALSELSCKYGLNILGPNCAGFANLPASVIATRLPCVSQPGTVSLVSQSGALMMALYGLFIDNEIGVSKLISVGNQVDLTLSETLYYLSNDPQTDLISAFVEGLVDGKRFIQGAEQALVKGKPIVMVKSGRTQSGIKIAETHTAAVAGSDKAFEAVCEQFGIILVDDVHQMMDVLKLHNTYKERLPKSTRFLVVTQSGGLGTLTADFFEKEGLKLTPLHKALLSEIKQDPNLTHINNQNNPVDVRGASLRDSATERTLTHFLQDPNFNLVMLLLARTSYQAEDIETAQAIVKVQKETGKPLVVVWVGQQLPIDQSSSDLTALRILRQANIPTFRQPSDAVKALAGIYHYWRYQEEYLRHVWVEES